MDDASIHWLSVNFRLYLRILLAITPLLKDSNAVDALLKARKHFADLPERRSMFAAKAQQRGRENSTVQRYIVHAEDDVDVWAFNRGVKRDDMPKSF